MDTLDEILPRPNIVAGGRSRWHWGAEPQRLVYVYGEQRDDGLVVRVVGHDGPTYVLLDEQPAQRVTPREVTFADGTTWRLANGGCGCGTPMRRFDPRRSQMRDGRVQ